MKKLTLAQVKDMLTDAEKQRRFFEKQYTALTNQEETKYLHSLKGKYLAIVYKELTRFIKIGKSCRKNIFATPTINAIYFDIDTSNRKQTSYGFIKTNMVARDLRNSIRATVFIITKEDFHKSADNMVKKSLTFTGQNLKTKIRRQTHAKAT